MSESCKLCGGDTQIRTTPYARYLDCLSCGESWIIEAAKPLPTIRIRDLSDDDLNDIKEPEPEEDEHIHGLGG